MNDCSHDNLTYASSLLRRWISTAGATPEPVRQLLADIADRHACQLADVFYSTMLSDPEAERFLTQDLVAKRLTHAIRHWIRTVFSSWEPESIPPVIEQQHTLGSVHARIGVRICLVLYAAGILKTALRDILRTADTADSLRIEAWTTAAALIDHAVEAISAHYESATEQGSRDDEAYRIYTATIDPSLERQRQRAAIMDWENAFLRAIMIGSAEEPLGAIGTSPFGLWVYHKATAIFDRSDDLRSIFATLRRIDDELLPACQREMDGASVSELRRLIRQVAGEIERVKYLLDAMFERLLHVESGRDALTKLLNRRFLPATHGHPAGDNVLCQIGERLSSAVRMGDFVFRYGGEEFLVLCTQTEERQALLTAERIRALIAGQPFDLGNGGMADVTVSIGVSSHDGHPDYQQHVARADKALYRAKNEGRNRVIVA
jgi:diguanylate cyclase